MVGVSYNGTLPNQVATTGVEGLETIVPISAISSWYDYYRANGLVVAPHSETQGVGENGFLGEDTDVLASFIGGSRMVPDGRCPDTLNTLIRRQDRVTGDYSPFWAARDYLDDVGDIRSSVFVVHGLNDWNVKTKAFAEWWYRLGQYGVPRKLWLHNGGHGGPPAAGERSRTRPPRTVGWTTELFGVQQRDHERAHAPRSSARTAPTTTRPTGPHRARARRTLHLSAPSATAPGGLSSGLEPVRRLIQELRGPRGAPSTPTTC